MKSIFHTKKAQNKTKNNNDTKKTAIKTATTDIRASKYI